MANNDAPVQGIRWSAPVLVRKGAEGLTVTLPERVVETLKLGAGDVLNFTELPGGSIEVWMVPKSTYANLDAMEKPAATKQGAGKKVAGKKVAGKKVVKQAAGNSAAAGPSGKQATKTSGKRAARRQGVQR